MSELRKPGGISMEQSTHSALDMHRRAYNILTEAYFISIQHCTDCSLRCPHGSVHHQHRMVKGLDSSIDSVLVSNILHYIIMMVFTI